MRKPSSVLRSSARRLRRPSPAMAVALVALFVALSGGAYAAVTLPAHSVGATQLKSFAVTNPKLGVNSVGSRKIMPGAVGFYRVNRTEVQLRLKNACATGQAITNVDVNGNVTCAPGTSETSSAPTTAVDVNSATAAASVSSLSLPAGAYTVQANPYITVTPSTNNAAAAQHVVVTCTLKAGTAAAQRSVSFDLPAANGSPAPQVQNASIPLVAVAPSSTAAAATDVSCVTSVTDTTGPNVGNASTNAATVKAQGQIYATQLASATTGTTATTTTTTTTATTTTPAP
jgi:hypothetical protein